MKNKKEFKEEPARHFDFWVKEKDSKIHCPFDTEANQPLIGLAQSGPPKTGKIIGDFKMFWDRFEYRWYS